MSELWSWSDHNRPARSAGETRPGNSGRSLVRSWQASNLRLNNLREHHQGCTPYYVMHWLEYIFFGLQRPKLETRCQNLNLYFSIFYLDVLLESNKGKSPTMRSSTVLQNEWKGDLRLTETVQTWPAFGIRFASAFFQFYDVATDWPMRFLETFIDLPMAVDATCHRPLAKADQPKPSNHCLQRVVS